MGANLNEAGCYSDQLMAFVITCLFCGALSKEEFNTWCAQAVSLREAPEYLYDLMTFDEAIFRVYKVIGYVPLWAHSESDEHALYGIAVLRGLNPCDMPLTASKALGQLEASTNIKELFNRVFDFISC
ncbi:hypothetical protein NLO88_15195 [Pseudomonas syringae]|nr:hypothetical protein [Pseudomonas syringae]